MKIGKDTIPQMFIMTEDNKEILIETMENYKELRIFQDKNGKYAIVTQDGEIDFCYSKIEKSNNRQFLFAYEENENKKKICIYNGTKKLGKFKEDDFNIEEGKGDWLIVSQSNKKRVFISNSRIKETFIEVKVIEDEKGILCGVVGWTREKRVVFIDRYNNRKVIAEYTEQCNIGLFKCGRNCKVIIETKELNYAMCFYLEQQKAYEIRFGKQSKRVPKITMIHVREIPFKIVNTLDEWIEFVVVRMGNSHYLYGINDECILKVETIKVRVSFDELYMYVKHNNKYITVYTKNYKYLFITGLVEKLNMESGTTPINTIWSDEKNKTLYTCYEKLECTDYFIQGSYAIIDDKVYYVANGRFYKVEQKYKKVFTPRLRTYGEFAIITGFISPTGRQIIRIYAQGYLIMAKKGKTSKDIEDFISEIKGGKQTMEEMRLCEQYVFYQGKAYKKGSLAYRIKRRKMKL